MKIWNCGYLSFERVQLGVCGMLCIDLSNDVITALGIHFSYNEKLKKERKLRP